MRYNLTKLFSLLYDNNVPACSTEEQDKLFEFVNYAPAAPRVIENADLQFIADYYSSGFNPSALQEQARLFFELSEEAFNIIIRAYMSELPIEKETLAFGRKIISSSHNKDCVEEKRKEAAKTAVDRSNAETLIVLNAAEKVQFEIHRMQGLLRFSPDKNGVYTARCAPDHLIIPALGEYLTARFGDTPWAVIDEKRGLILSRNPPEQAKTAPLKTCSHDAEQGDEWEELWKHYHKTINNEDRKNTNLQRQLMPKRYWKYLPEV